MEDVGFCSVANAAIALNCSEQHVRTLLRQGRLSGHKVGHSWVVPQCSIDDFMEKPGSPPAVANDRARRDRLKGELVGLSFFSGALGLDLGLEQAGITTLLAAEIDPAARATIVANRPNAALVGDIRDYTASDLRRLAGVGNRQIDVAFGGPPCQAFSTAGKRQGFDDERGNVALKFIELILELQPRYVVIENVRGLMSAPLRHRPHNQRGAGFPPLTPEEQPGGALTQLLRLISEGGYTLSFNLYNSANFGAPQIRERLIIVAARGASRVPYLRPTHAQDGDFGLPPWITLREALSKCPESDSEHTFVTFPEKRLRFYRLLRPGQNWRDLPRHLQEEAMGASFHAGGGRTGFYRRLAWDEPAPTLVTHPAMPATDLCHPEKDRPLSVEEYRAIQAFPDDWTIAGNKIDQYRQLGNAVPIPLGRAVGRAIVNHMTDACDGEIDGFPYSRYRGTSDIEWRAQMAKQPRQKQLVFTEQ
jgi:DNA (cytosine-5)-methyltransferase 1